MGKIIKIGLTGAPCSGKSTILEKLNNDLSKRLNVIICPEAATLLIENGESRDDYSVFETKVAFLQKQLEADAEKRAEALDGDTLIICDRTLTDCFCYVEDKKKLSSNIGDTILSSWNRYDTVLFLEMPDEEHYEKNENRIESFEQAIEYQNKLLDVLVGHPHFRYVKSNESFDEKYNYTLAEIEAVLSGVETEKKYLIEYPNFDELFKLKCFKAEISQTYLLSSVGAHRVRQRGANGEYTYFETLKLRISGMSAQEDERIISKEEYKQLLSIADPKKHPIVKDRYCFLYDGQYFELDVFPFWNDKALIELELTNEDQAVNLPPFIKVIKDVSNDKKYKNNYLASLKL